MTGTLYPYSFPKIEAFLEGRLMEGGRANLIDTTMGLDKTFDVAPTRFALISMLTARSLAVHSRGEPGSNSFVDTQQLLAEYKRLYGPIRRQQLGRYTYDLRIQLDEVLRPATNGHAVDWSRLIETTTLGRRISVPPENLTLVLHDAHLLSPDFR